MAQGMHPFDKFPVAKDNRKFFLRKVPHVFMDNPAILLVVFPLGKRMFFTTY